MDEIYLLNILHNQFFSIATSYKIENLIEKFNLILEYAKARLLEKTDPHQPSTREWRKLKHKDMKLEKEFDPLCE